MDKKSQQILLEAEASALTAEAIKPITDDKTLAEAIKQAFEMNRHMDLLSKARTAKNASYQKKIREHSNWYKPMIDRLERNKEALRDYIRSHMNPTGDLGNQNVEEVRAYGSGGVGTASFAEIVEYNYDLVVLAELNPHLLKVDERAVKKLASEGCLPQGIKPKPGYQLRIQ